MTRHKAPPQAGSYRRPAIPAPKVTEDLQDYDLLTCACCWCWHKQLEGFTPERLGKALALAAGFDEETSHRAIKDLKVRHLEDFLAKPQYGANTKAMMAKLLKAITNWALQAERSTVDPFARFKPKGITSRPFAIVPTEVEFRQLSLVGTELDRDLILCQGYTGCRPKELLSVTGAQVDLESRVIDKRGDHKEARAGKERHILIASNILPIFQQRMARYGNGYLFVNRAGRPYKSRHWTCRFPILRDQAGVRKQVTAYGLRHFFAILCWRAGILESEVATLMGHSDVKMIRQVYLHLGDQRKILLNRLDKAFESL